MPQTIFIAVKSLFKAFVLCGVLIASVDQTWAKFPAPRLVRLTDGRCLEYADYGDPSGRLVLYFHGSPGSHLDVQAAASDIHASGLHVVAINRPGIGRSSFQCGRKITDWPKDVSECLELIGRKNEPFGIIGFSGGAPYALACARMMPNRITRVAIVSGHTSLGIRGVVPGECDRTIELFLRRPRFAEKAVELTRHRLQRKPDKTVKRIVKKWDPNDRRLVTCSPLIRGLLEGSMLHSTRCGGQGVVTDVQLLGRCWGFDVADVVGPPISIWHGRCDRIAPISMGRYFHSQLVGSALHVDPAAGHLSMFKWHSPEIHREFCTD